MSALKLLPRAIQHAKHVARPRWAIPALANATIKLQTKTNQTNFTSTNVKAPPIPHQKYTLEERPHIDAEEYHGDKFLNFEQRAKHLLYFIYKGIKPMYKINSVNMHINYKHHKSGHIILNNDNILEIVLSTAGMWRLTIHKNKEIIDLFTPVKNRTYSYQYHKDKDVWLDTVHNEKNLLIELASELDEHGEGYPHFGLEPKKV